MELTDPARARQEKVSEVWGKPHTARTLWNHPYYGEWLFGKFGDPTRHWAYSVKERYFKDVIFDSALALGSGFGNLDRLLFKLGYFKACLGLDVADGAIEAARREAASEGLPIAYLKADLNDRLPLAGRGKFDFAYANACLHHVENLEDLFSQLRECMSDDGILMFYEYCGPSRFQWRDKTMSVANRILDVLPARLKGEMRQVVRPAWSVFTEGDPSEAVRSEEILSMTRMFFDVVDQVRVGTTITHPLLNGILKHFDEADEVQTSLVKLIFCFEDVLIEEGVLEADTNFVIARPRFSTAAAGAASAGAAVVRMTPGAPVGDAVVQARVTLGAGSAVRDEAARHRRDTGVTRTVRGRRTWAPGAVAAVRNWLAARALRDTAWRGDVEAEGVASLLGTSRGAHPLARPVAWLLGYRLLPGPDLRTAVFLAYPIEPGRQDLSAVYLVPRLEARARAGELGLELVGPDQRVVRQVTVPAVTLEDSAPVRFDLDPVVDTDRGRYWLRVFVRDADVPIRILEWRRHVPWRREARRRILCGLLFKK